MKTWRVTCTYGKPAMMTEELVVKGRTRADAVMEAQKQAAKSWGLDRSSQSLINVNFTCDFGGV